MQEKKVIIYGIGKLAEYAAYVFKEDSNFNVIGYCIEEDYLKSHPELSNIQSFENITSELLKTDTFLFIAVGNNIIRERIFSIAKQNRFKFATYVSSRASTWENLKIGENCFIGEGSIIQPFVEIKNNSFLFGARLGHHCVIGENVLLSGPTLGGNVKIGDYSFIGLNSVIQQNIQIGKKNIIGMGVAITKSTLDHSVFSAPKIKKRDISYDQISDNYLK